MTQLLTDDERAMAYGLPTGCRMREGAKILSPESFRCGEYVWIGEGAILDASGGLSIGSHTSIGPGVLVWSHTSYLTNLALDNVIGSELIQRQETSIGAGCFIAGPSVVYPGVHIGEKCMVLPMSVVTEDLAPYSMAVGNPAKVQRTLSEEQIAKQVEYLRRQARA